MGIGRFVSKPWLWLWEATRHWIGCACVCVNVQVKICKDKWSLFHLLSTLSEQGSSKVPDRKSLILIFIREDPHQVVRKTSELVFAVVFLLNRCWTVVQFAGSEFFKAGNILTGSVWTHGVLHRHTHNEIATNIPEVMANESQRRPTIQKPQISYG